MEGGPPGVTPPEFWRVAVTLVASAEPSLRKPKEMVTDSPGSMVPFTGPLSESRTAPAATILGVGPITEITEASELSAALVSDERVATEAALVRKPRTTG